MSFLSSIKKLDWIILLTLLLLSAFSLSFLYFYNTDIFLRQLTWCFISFLVIIVSSQINWEWFFNQKVFLYGFYVLSLILLFVSHLQNRLVRGTKGWLNFGGFNLEPAELAKVALIFILSVFFMRRYIAGWRMKYIFVSFFLAFIPTFLVAIHPDLGSAIVLISIWIGFMLFGGIHKKRFLVGLFIFLIIGVLVWNYFLKDYQKERLIAFLFPNKDPLGANYNVIQSKIAIGSGGFWGKGLGQGTQTQFRFLPEAHTDFIFAALVEEWGFLGCFILILTYAILFYRLFYIGLNASGNSFKFLVLGSIIVLAFQTFINIGVNVGLLPVTGITLPFVSYGGSSLLTGALLIGIIQHIKIVSR